MQSIEKQGARPKTPKKEFPNRVVNNGKKYKFVPIIWDEDDTNTPAHKPETADTSKISWVGKQTTNKRSQKNQKSHMEITTDTEPATMQDRPSISPYFQGQWDPKQSYKIETILDGRTTPQGAIPTYRTHAFDIHSTSSRNNRRHPLIIRQPKVKKQDLQTEGTIFPDPQTWLNKTHNASSIKKHKQRIGEPYKTTPNKTPPQPIDTHTLVNQTDKYGLPIFWQSNGMLVLSPEGLPRCHYCGIPSHNRNTCRKRRKDEQRGRYYPTHPNRGLFPGRYSQMTTTKHHNQVVKTNYQTGVSWVCTCGCNPKVTPRGHSTNKDDTFTRESLPSSTTNTLNLMDMPLEIMEKILLYIPFKQRICLQRVNHRIRNQILGSGALWKRIFIRNSYLDSSIMKRIIKAKPTSLDIPGCVWKPTQLEIGEMIVDLNIFEPKLEYLGLQGFEGNTSIMALIIIKSKNLKTLDLSEASFALLNHVLHQIDRTNKIINLDMSVTDRPHLRRRLERGDTTAIDEMYTRIQQNTIPDLVTKCIWITRLNLCGSGLSQDSIVVICHLVTPTLSSINLAGEFVRDEHVEALAHRCPMMQYINLAETAVSRATLRIITGKWKHSLEDLSLPDRYVRLFQLHGLHGPVQEHDDFKRQIDSITNLDRLHVGHYRFGEIDVNNRRKSTKVMTEMFPTLSINLDPFGEAGPSNSNPDNKFNSTIKPRNWARRL